MGKILHNIICTPWQNCCKETDMSKLLEIADWSSVTPMQLRQYIKDGYIVDWIDGYDVGPSPLTNALQQNAAPEIIDILIEAGANVNAPTILTNGVKMTPLEIIRSQESTHENMQKELMLLRAGALDDIWQWLYKDERYPPEHWRKINHIGIWRGFGNKYAYRVYEPIPVQAEEFIEPCYIVAWGGKTAWSGTTNADEWDIYDKIASYGNTNTPEAIIRNELGDKLAKQFMTCADELSFPVAMYKYYTYLSSLYADTDAIRANRISAAAHDFRLRHFSYDNWNELINITPTITAKTEYNKLKKQQYPEMYEYFNELMTD